MLLSSPHYMCGFLEGQVNMVVARKASLSCCGAAWQCHPYKAHPPFPKLREGHFLKGGRESMRYLRSQVVHFGANNQLVRRVAYWVAHHVSEYLVFFFGRLISFSPIYLESLDGPIRMSPKIMYASVYFVNVLPRNQEWVLLDKQNTSHVMVCAQQGGCGWRGRMTIFHPHITPLLCNT